MKNFLTTTLFVLLFLIACSGASFSQQETSLTIDRFKFLLHRSSGKIFSDESIIRVGNKSYKANDIRFFRGHVADEPSMSAMVVQVGSLKYGKIIDPSGNEVIVSDYGESFHRSRSIRPPNAPLNCNTVDNPFETSVFPTLSKIGTNSDDSTIYELELAIEADYEFFKATGANEDAALLYLSALFSNINDIYERDLGVRIQLSWVHIWTDSLSDPYQAAGNHIKLMETVQSKWNDFDTVARDLLHVITASPFGSGGYGYTNVLCVDNNYSISGTSIQGWNDLSPYGFSYDVYIIAHEIGHNLGAHHTHSCFYGGYPLDTCQTDEGLANGCLDPSVTARPNPGSIMSYCTWPNLDAGNGFQVAMKFRPEVASVIRSYVQSIPSCLTPVITDTSTVSVYSDEPSFKNRKLNLY